MGGELCSKSKLLLLPRITIQTGRYASVDQVCNLLRRPSSRCDLKPVAEQILSQIPVETKPGIVNLVVVTPGDLCQKGMSIYKQICGLAKQYNFQLCRPELAAYLCLHCAEQLEGKLLHVATKPLNDEQKKPRLLMVGCNNGRRLLAAAHADRKALYYPFEYFVFVERVTRGLG